MGSWTVVTRSSRQTKYWGSKLGKLLTGGEIIGLVGELGAGKTCFVRGMAEGLEVGTGAWIRSPTFTLINEYHGRLPVYHIDLYRADTDRELETLALDDLPAPDSILLIEWGEKFPRFVRHRDVEIFLERVGETERRIQLTSS